MRYEEARLNRGAVSLLLRLRLWLAPGPTARRQPFADLSGLSEHQLKDIGLTSHSTGRRPLPGFDR